VRVTVVHPVAWPSALALAGLSVEVSRLSVRGGEDVAAVEDLPAGMKSRMELCR
jgi:hypothetical protein